MRVMRDTCTAASKAKDIIRVVIKGASGYGPVDLAFQDKVTITGDSIQYEYKPYVVSEDNPVRKWSYKTTNPVFQRKFDKLTKLIPGVMAMDKEFAMDVGAIRFTITYSDKTKETREFFIPGVEFKKVFSVIREMVPRGEEAPAVIGG